MNPAGRQAGRLGTGGDQAAVIEAWMIAAVLGHARQVRLAACRRQHREPARREAKGADPARVQGSVAVPVLQHVVDQDMQLARAFGYVGGAAVVAPVVARVGQTGDHEPGLGQGARGVLMPAKVAARAVGHDDQAAVLTWGGVGGPPDADLDGQLRAVRGGELLEHYVRRGRRCGEGNSKGEGGDHRRAPNGEGVERRALAVAGSASGVSPMGERARGAANGGAAREADR